MRSEYCCPNCRDPMKLDSVLPGDMAVCVSCGQPLIFEARMVPEIPAPGVVEARCFLHPGLWSQLVRAQQRAKTHPISDVALPAFLRSTRVLEAEP
jgi:hypothetical protein